MKTRDATQPLSNKLILGTFMIVKNIFRNIVTMSIDIARIELKTNIKMYQY